MQITCPQPTPFTAVPSLPSIQILWDGSDPDGSTGEPVEYKYLLLHPNSEFPLALALSDPDSLRRYYAHHPLGPWAGWDSTGADTTRVRFTNLIPGPEYLFAVVAFDEAGDYSPVFSLSSNLLRFRVTFAGFTGPRLTLLGPGLEYQYPSGGYCVCPAAEVPVDVAANQPVTFQWFADPDGLCGGANVRAYRWTLDIEDVFDDTPRSDEQTDVRHWSARSPSTTSATVGPFAVGEEHFLYVEAEDTAGLKSLGIFKITVVANQAPECAGALPQPAEIWPPNGAFVPVSVTGVTDPDGGPVTVTVTRVTQDEPLRPRATQCADAIIGSDGTVQVRAERLGGGNGRVYTIEFTASDGRGGFCEGAVKVCVPRDRRQAACVDDGSQHDSGAPCTEGSHGQDPDASLAAIERLSVGRAGSTATIRYSLTAPAPVRIAVFDVAGRRVETLENASRSAGAHEVAWDTSRLREGVYFCRVQAGPATMTRSILVSK